MMNRVFFLLLSILLLVIACSRDERNDSTRDKWFSWPEPYTFIQNKNHQVPFFEINERFQKYFIKQLENKQWVEISQQNLFSVISGNAKVDRTKKHYLVRALFYNKPTGCYEIFVDSHNNILVDHGCLGNASKPMSREVLVIELNVKPKNVFTVCSMIE